MSLIFPTCEGRLDIVLTTTHLNEYSRTAFVRQLCRCFKTRGLTLWFPLVLDIIVPVSSLFRQPQVIKVEHGLGGMKDSDADEPSTMGESENRRRKAFLRELGAMIRLRSPHTVHVYGKITSQQDRLVLVMELLVGGDLRTLLDRSNQPLPAEQPRRILEDVCAGMTFLHSKDTVHGDLKSANVLLDGNGRAKVRYNPVAETILYRVAVISTHPSSVPRALSPKRMKALRKDVQHT